MHKATQRAFHTQKAWNLIFANDSTMQACADLYFFPELEFSKILKSKI